MNEISIEALTAQVAGLTAPKLFLDLVAAHPDVPALHSMNGAAPGDWNRWTFAQYADQVARAAGGLADAGLHPGDRLLLMMRNRPDMHWFDTAAQFLRATPVSIYNSSSPEEIQYLAHHAEAEIVVVEDAGFLDRVLKIRHELPMLKRVYVIEPPADGLPDGVLPASEGPCTWR